VSPVDAPSLKISLHGGSVGPKHTKQSSQQLARADARRATKQERAAADADGFVQPKSRGAEPTSVGTNLTTESCGQTVGGVFAALAEPPSGSSGADSPTPMTKSAKKNARRRAAKQRETEEAKKFPSVEVAAVIADHIEATPMTDAEMAECDAEMAAACQAHQPHPSNGEIADAAAEFLAESQIREEGAENAAAWHIDAATGSMLYHDEMTAADAATIVPAHEVLDVDGLHAAINTAEGN